VECTRLSFVHFSFLAGLIASGYRGSRVTDLDRGSLCGPDDEVEIFQHKQKVGASLQSQRSYYSYLSNALIKLSPGVDGESFACSTGLSSPTSWGRYDVVVKCRHGNSCVQEHEERPFEIIAFLVL
jgi:hypothetical protein